MFMFLKIILLKDDDVAKRRFLYQRQKKKLNDAVFLMLSLQSNQNESTSVTASKEIHLWHLIVNKYLRFSQTRCRRVKIQN